MDGQRLTYEFTFNERPWTVNAERAGNRWDRAKKTKYWREQFCLLCRIQSPIVLTDAIVEVRLNLKGRLQDTSACLPAVKAAVDGLVDGGLFLDDTGDHVKCIVFWAPVRSKSDALMISVTGLQMDTEGYTQPK